VLQEINGRERRGRGRATLVDGFARLKNDGSTSCGCWIYAGVHPHDERNRARERAPDGPYGHGWGFAWPMDRRILYNRASARPDGHPGATASADLVGPARREWTGADTPDFNRTKPPGYRPARDARGDAALRGDASVRHARRWAWVDLGGKRA
jgi:formate dehydrogenase major subunit